MSKLSTSVLKDMIGEWLSKPEIRDDLKHHSEMDDPDRIVEDWANKVNTTQFERERRMWEAPQSVSTPALLEEYIWKLWCDGSRWKRQEKRQLKEEYESYFCESDYPENWQRGQPVPQKPYFPEDMLGESNAALVEKYFNDPKQAAKCIFRCFVPDNQLADNYRLEVVTTPEDDAVIGWLVIVD